MKFLTDPYENAKNSLKDFSEQLTQKGHKRFLAGLVVVALGSGMLYQGLDSVDNFISMKFQEAQARNSIEMFQDINVYGKINAVNRHEYVSLKARYTLSKSNSIHIEEAYKTLEDSLDNIICDNGKLLKDNLKWVDKNGELQSKKLGDFRYMVKNYLKENPDKWSIERTYKSKYKNYTAEIDIKTLSDILKKIDVELTTEKTVEKTKTLDKMYSTLHVEKDKEIDIKKSGLSV